MKWILPPLMLLGILTLALIPAPQASADGVPKEYRASIRKGLDWVAKTQNPAGHWDVSGGRYPVAMTALAGVALLMEGSTLRDGKYSVNLRRAVDWMMDRTQPNGLIGNPNVAVDRERYMYGHGFGLLFLASAYGEEEDADRRQRLESILTRAVEYVGRGQTKLGGWGYLANGCSTEGDGLDEGSVTITQMQALRAAKNAGITVPLFKNERKTAVEKAQEYLEKSTGPGGGIIYSLGMNRRDERPALAAAAVACGFSSGEYTSPLVKGWLQVCKRTIPPVTPAGGRMGHDEYAHYYLAQILYALGDDGYGKLFPDSRPEDRLTWTKYRKQMFDALVSAQNEDGSWSGNGRWGSVGPIYSTSIALTIMQLDNATLPIYQR